MSQDTMYVLAQRWVVGAQGKEIGVRLTLLMRLASEALCAAPWLSVQVTVMVTSW